jgi:hypothetical protein
MDTPNATRANAALWAHYIDQRWGSALSPVGGVLASGLIGIGIANMYAAFWGDVIGRLFAANASQVTRFAQENVEDVLPPWPATPLPETDQDALPPWLRISFDDELAERVRLPEPLVVPV